MKKYSTFKKLNELMQTKTVVVSIIPLLTGFGFVYYYYHHFNWKLSLIFAITTVILHFAVNSYNQYTDWQRFKQAKSNEDSVNNILKQFDISPRFARTTIGILIGIVAALGIYLTLQTSILVFIIGIISTFIGFAYSGGPRPILKTPFSEPIAGLTMGYNIPLIAVYINIYGTSAFDQWFWLKTLLAAMPLILVIANLMVANNVADYKEDIATGRRTLIYYLGVDAGLQLWALNYVMAYLFLIITVLVSYMPWEVLLTLLTAPILYRNSMKFIKKPKKATTFLNAIFNIQIFTIVQFLLLVVGIIFKSN